MPTSPSAAMLLRNQASLCTRLMVSVVYRARIQHVFVALAWCSRCSSSDFKKNAVRRTGMTAFRRLPIPRSQQLPSRRVPTPVEARDEKQPEAVFQASSNAQDKTEDQYRQTLRISVPLNALQFAPVFSLAQLSARNWTYMLCRQLSDVRTVLVAAVRIPPIAGLGGSDEITASRTPYPHFVHHTDVLALGPHDHPRGKSLSLPRCQTPGCHESSPRRDVPPPDHPVLCVLPR